MKAKPTIYRGIHFRSRLEARWAVFWDSLSYPWVYEPTTPSRDYQPDFECATDPPGYVEIKSEAWDELSESERQHDWDRWWALCEASGHLMVVMFGPPGQWQGGRLAAPFTRGLIVRGPAMTDREWVEWWDCDACRMVALVRVGHRLDCGCGPPHITRAMADVRNFSFDPAP